MTTTESPAIVAHIKRWLIMRAEIEQRKLELSDLNKKFTKYSSEIDELMALEGVQNVAVNGHKIYRTSRRSVTRRPGVPLDALCDALRGTDLAYLVTTTVNASSLKGAMLERIDAGEEIPDHIAELIRVDSFQTIAARKA